MSDKLSIDLQNNILLINGQIDEDSNFESLFKGQKSIFKLKEIFFDFANVSLINSCGIREWIKFVNTFEPSSQLHYRNCPQIIIEQINMVHGFIRKGSTIESFYAPYYCEQCDMEKKVHLKVSDLKTSVSGSSSSYKAPVVKCEKCQQDMEFDAIEEQYFHFLKQINSHQ